MADVPTWLTSGFAEGVDERYATHPVTGEHSVPNCWLSPFDARRRPCSGPANERFHFLRRQTVESAVFYYTDWELDVNDAAEQLQWMKWLAGWDPRNGAFACEGHHRRFDGHATPGLDVPMLALPEHVIEFALGWGFDYLIEAKFL